MRKASLLLVLATILPTLVLGRPAWADDVRLAMEAANVQFLAAFNTPNPSAFLPLYTADAVLFFQGSPPVRGPEAIKQFWEHGSRPASATTHSISSRLEQTASMRFRSPTQPSSLCADPARKLSSPATP
jgi:hypothetical protein